MQISKKELYTKETFVEITLKDKTKVGVLVKEFFSSDKDHSKDSIDIEFTESDYLFSEEKAEEVKELIWKEFGY